MKFLKCLGNVAVAAVIGFCLGFPIWLIAILTLGTPIESPNGANIPRAMRMEHMNYFQWFLENYGWIVIPLICMLAGASLAHRITNRNARHQQEQELHAHSVTVEAQDNNAGYQVVE